MLNHYRLDIMEWICRKLLHRIYKYRLFSFLFCSYYKVTSTTWCTCRRWITQGCRHSILRRCQTHMQACGNIGGKFQVFTLYLSVMINIVFIIPKLDFSTKSDLNFHFLSCVLCGHVMTFPLLVYSRLHWSVVPQGFIFGPSLGA